jgi:hypothetical protein
VAGEGLSEPTGVARPYDRAATPLQTVERPTISGKPHGVVVIRHPVGSKGIERSSQFLNAGIAADR